MALQLFLLSYVLLPLSTIIELRPEQAENAETPIFVTEFGIVIDVRLVQASFMQLAGFQVILF